MLSLQLVLRPGTDLHLIGSLSTAALLPTIDIFDRKMRIVGTSRVPKKDQKGPRSRDLHFIVSMSTARLGLLINVVEPLKVRDVESRGSRGRVELWVCAKR